MDYSALVTRLLIAVGRCIGNGCLAVSMLAGFLLLNEGAFFIGAMCILVPLLIWARRPLRPVFNFLNLHVFKPTILKIYRRLSKAWIAWGGGYVLKELFLEANLMGEYAFRDCIDNLFTLSFLTLLALTIIKIVLFIANARRDGIILRDEQGNEYRAYKIDEDMLDSEEGMFGWHERELDYRSDPSHPSSWHND